MSLLVRCTKGRQNGTIAALLAVYHGVIPPQPDVEPNPKLEGTIHTAAAAIEGGGAVVYTKGRPRDCRSERS